MDSITRPNFDNSNISWNSNYTYSGGSGGTGYVGDNCTWTYPQLVTNYYEHWYPLYYPVYQVEKSKTDLAFKILKALQDKGKINITKVKDFIEMVDEISKIL